jgi:hypothetical protein
MHADSSGEHHIHLSMVLFVVVDVKDYFIFIFIICFFRREQRPARPPSVASIHSALLPPAACCSLQQTIFGGS